MAEASSSTSAAATSEEVDAVRSRYERSGQGHVFEYYEDLVDDEKKELLRQLRDIKVEQIAKLRETTLKESSKADGGDDDIRPFAGPVGRPASDESLRSRCRSVGTEAIRKGQVAALVLAGGQGTRLGFDGPKGMYDIGLPSGRTLFRMMAERILKLSRLAAETGGLGGKEEMSSTAKVIPFYVMTSPLNHEDTKAYFEQNDYFGLGSENVRFFRQGTLPCLTDDGKIIMESKGKVAVAPDGNGGIYPSLKLSGALDDMTERGVLYLHVFSIDNALIKPADPVFVGYCISQNADCGNKVVWKSHPHEKVGVIASRGSKPCVVEYSEITEEMAESTSDDGVLLYGAGNICNHFYTLEFIRDKVLPNLGDLYHVARKKIPYYDKDQDATVTPTTANNGIKLETFIFDVFPLSERMAVLEVPREEEFAPVKNKAGSQSDSPDTARELMSGLCRRWVADAGGTLTGDEKEGVCEIAPLTSYNGEGLESLVGGKSVECPFTL